MNVKTETVKTYPKCNCIQVVYIVADNKTYSIMRAASQAENKKCKIKHKYIKENKK